MEVNKKTQFAKKIIISTTLVFLLSLFTALIWSWFSKDVDVFIYIIPTVGGVWGASIIWYMKKAQLENGIKIQLGMIEELIKLKNKYRTDDDSVDEIQDKVESRMQNNIDNFIDEALTPPEIQTF